MVDRSGREPLVSHGQGVQSLSHLAAHNFGGTYGIRTRHSLELLQGLAWHNAPRAKHATDPIVWYPASDSNREPTPFERIRTSN